MKKSIYVIGLSRFTSPSGICRYAFNLTDILSGIDDVKVTLVVGKWQEDYYKNAFNWSSVNADLEVISIKNTSLSRNLWFLFILPILLIRRKANWLFFSFPIPFFSFLTPNVKIVTSIHDLYPFEYPQNFRFPFFNRIFTKMSAKSANIISALSNNTSESIKKNLPAYESKIVVNYTPFPYQSIGEYDIIEDEYYLTVAQHRKNKNLDVLIRSFGELKKLTKDKKKLIIIGSKGPETQNLLHLVQQYNIEDYVVFLHGISDAELINYYLNCSCFILLSSTEGLGLPLIESLYYCKYVICSDIPVFREIDELNCNFINLEDKPQEQLVALWLNGLNINTKFGIKDRRFDIDDIRVNYKRLIKFN
jgi:glycosyltransferase involved in cell wall biosynthesis